MKRKIEIKNRFTGDILFSFESENNTIKETIKEALKSRANLSDADLSDATDETGAKVKAHINMCGSMHRIFWRGNGIIKIGCIEKSIIEWQNEFVEIGKQQNYSDDQIAEYGRYIKMIAELQENLK